MEFLSSNIRHEIRADKTINYRNLALSLLLLAFGMFFAFFNYVIARAEIMPAIRSGTYSVQTSSMNLNIVWEGNEIYLLLCIYAVIALAFLAASVNIARKALRPKMDADPQTV